MIVVEITTNGFYAIKIDDTKIFVRFSGMESLYSILKDEYNAYILSRGQHQLDIL